MSLALSFSVVQTVIAQTQQTVWLDTSGSDTQGNGTESNPWATFSRIATLIHCQTAPPALNLTVNLRSGTYRKTSDPHLLFVPIFDLTFYLGTCGLSFRLPSSSSQMLIRAVQALEAVVDCNSTARQFDFEQGNFSLDGIKLHNGMADEGVFE